MSFLAACGDDSKKPAAPPPGPPPVHVGHPVLQHLTEWDEYTGRFRARDQVDVRARVSGYLTSINFTDGDRVKKGDLLFVIDQRPYEVALQHAEASYELAKQNEARIAPLLNTGAVSQQEYDQAQQQVKDSAASVKDAQLNLTFSEVRAPISGRVSRHMVDVGNVVNGTDANGTVLTSIVADDPIYFYFDASEQELLKYIRLAQSGKRESSRDAHRQVLVELQDETDFTHGGTVDFVDNQLDNNSGTIQFRGVFPNPDGTLVSGMFGRARIAGSGEEDAVLVPDEVIGTNQTKKFVYVVGKDNKLEPRPIEIGSIYENNMRIVHSGLSPDDTIVLGGLMMLQPGMTITPKMDDANAAAAAPATADTKPSGSDAKPSGSDAKPSDSDAKPSGSDMKAK
jgi:RND family efflux transporter MFP subunit